MYICVGVLGVWCRQCGGECGGRGYGGDVLPSSTCSVGQVEVRTQSRSTQATWEGLPIQRGALGRANMWHLRRRSLRRSERTREVGKEIEG
jgi:hypothetical protein